MSPCDYDEYHPEWKSIRRQILDQADNCCEFGGVENYGYGERVRGTFRPLDEYTCLMGEERCVRIVLTIAHLDHDVTNNEPCNLRALCQQCHLRWDAEHHQVNAAATRRSKRIERGQMELAVAS